MICKVCNKEVEDGVLVCPFCGADLSKKEEKVINVNFKKPEGPPVITVNFLEPVYEEPQPEPEPMPEPQPEPQPEPVVEEVPVETPKKDKINVLFLILSLLWAPYPGIALWVITSKKTPKASQVYGICGIAMLLLAKACYYIAQFLKIVAVVVVLLLCAAVSVALVMMQYNITFPQGIPV